MKRICIVAAKRTPQGRFLGALKKYSALDLALAAGKSVLQEMATDKIDQVILGNVLAAGQGMNLARQVGVHLKIPLDRPAYTVNMMCASGMQAIMLAAQTIQASRANAILCGGAESMSNAPYLLDRARGGYKLGDGVLIDSLLKDGLVDSFDNQHMGLTAERIAAQYTISRSEQDEFSVQSQQKYGLAHQQGQFADELVALDELDQDEHPRPETTAEKLSTLEPAFNKNGTVTAGNASGINDGAALCVVCDEATAQKNGWQPLAVITDFAAVGCDPKVMGLGPVYATRELCKKQLCKVDDFDTVEINEAFAAQTLGCMKELNIDPKRLNPEGGAIALGHPIGASGARLIVHLSHRIARGETQKGLAALCVGGGMGTVTFLETY